MALVLAGALPGVEIANVCPRAGRSQATGTSRAGFTLVELMIATSIFLVVALAFTGAYLSALRTHLMSSDYYKATCIARNRLERAKALAFDSLPLMAEEETPVDADGNPDPAGVFRRTTVVSNSVVNCARITVQVRFPKGNGGLSDKTVDVHTMIADGVLE